MDFATFRESTPSVQATSNSILKVKLKVNVMLSFRHLFWRMVTASSVNQAEHLVSQEFIAA